MFTLPSLPFETDALQPDMSEATLRVHHGGHHRAYVDKLNELVADTPWAGLTLETLIQRTRGEGDRLQQRIFQNAAQDWNHAMFWSSLAPGGMTSPGPALSAMVERDFGSLEALRRQFVELGTGHFGSGWIWLVVENGNLGLVTTHDAENPLGSGADTLLVCDLWEHAYYLDHQNRRAAFLTAFIERLANWDRAEARLHEIGRGAGRGFEPPVPETPTPAPPGTGTDPIVPRGAPGGGTGA